MNDLVEWLREQFDIDAERAEAAARERGGYWSAQSLQVGGKETRHYVGGSSSERVSSSDATVLGGSAAAVRHAAAHGPARVLRDIDAKRKIVDFAAVVLANEHGIYERTSGDHQYNTLRLLALAYADRPGYLDEWRP